VIRLRPHHLLCALTFVGEGYSDAFVANFRELLARIDAGEAIELVAGPDDICAPLVAEDGGAHCVLERITISDALTAGALREDDGLAGLLTGGVLDRDRLARMRAAFATGSIRGACVACSWHALCTTVADEGYARSLMRGSDAS
jgi:hypothetical protein